MNGMNTNHLARLATAVREDDRRRTSARRRALDATAGAGPKPPTAPEATERELEVLGVVADGRTDREIATALFISQQTASVRVTHILDKMGVASRVEAALRAPRAGFAHERSAGSADEAAPAERG